MALAEQAEAGTEQHAVVQPNILVISDLHLGEDIKPATKTGYLRHIAILERELIDFLEHYGRTRRDGRPWRLIINGDMVDFLSVCLLPQPGDDFGEETDPEDRVYGLGTRPLQARRKMQRVLERHPGVFRALARFIARGNQVGIVVGNHDVEFHWPVVQETFKQGVAALFDGSRPGAGADIEAGITFHPWFYFQEDVVWIEHGHQYDDYCSFDYVLNPMAPEKDEMVMSLGAASYRYVANHVEGTDPHQAEDWNALGYVRFGLMLGARGIWQLATGYLMMVWKLLTIWRVFAKQGDKVEARRHTHRERLRQLATQVKLSEETLTALDDLRNRPVITNFARLAMAIMLDRVIVVGAAALLILVFVLALPWVWVGAAVAGVLGGAWGFGQLLARSRSDVDPQVKMQLMPQKIRAHVRAPFVVFGHSHFPVALPLAGGGWYFNTGTWLAAERPGLLKAFTHVMIRHAEGGLRAALCQWRDGKSLVVGTEARAR